MLGNLTTGAAIILGEPNHDAQADGAVFDEPRPCQSFYCPWKSILQFSPTIWNCW